MQYLPPALEALTEQFAKLPGVGRKSAQRLAFFVLSLPMEEAQAFADAIVDAILADVKSSEPVTEGGEVYYPGELELKNIKENKELGVPVIEEVWESVLKM